MCTVLNGINAVHFLSMISSKQSSVSLRCSLLEKILLIAFGIVSMPVFCLFSTVFGSKISHV